MGGSNDDSPREEEVAGLHTRKHSLQWLWWVGGVVVGLAGAGWISRGWLDNQYQQAPEIESHIESDAKIHQELNKTVSEHDEELEDNRYINARIEITQRQIQRRLDRNYKVDQARLAGNWQERRHAEEEAEELDREIQEVEAALKKSYEQRPPIPTKGNRGSMPDDDPLAGLDEF